MKLVEHISKELLRNCGIKIPNGIVTNNKSYVNLSYHKEKYKEFFFENKSVVIKAQVTEGKRKKNGLILLSSDYEDSLKIIDTLYNTKVGNDFVKELLIEKKLDVDEEYFISILYHDRKPLILFSKKGGIDVEENTNFAILEVSPLNGINDFQSRDLAKDAGFKGNDILKIASFIKKVYDCFVKYDCTFCEINPIIKTKDGILYAGDAKIIIDDNSMSRQEFLRDITDDKDDSLSERENEARRIDRNDYRGVAGKSYIDLDGDIAVIASGGGASLTCMDALIEAGGRPANYVEYSGNPTLEKVEQMSKIVLSKPNLKGCLVIGGTANFTDIYETLRGFSNAIKSLPEKPKYPFVIRRAGPRDKEAFEMLKNFAQDEQIEMHLYGEEMPMTKAAKLIVEKAYDN